MLCVVIKGPTFEEAFQQITQALPYADLVELRLDWFTALDCTALKRLCDQFTIPMIFALRSASQGGGYSGSEENRLTAIRSLIAIKPAYIDLEYHVPVAFIEEMAAQCPEVKLILSYHHFTKTPEDLEEIHQSMRKTAATFYKIAVTANSSLDALRLICWAKKAGNNRLIAISMGSYGQISRILSPVIGCPITYAALDEESCQYVPGQLSAKILIEKYHHRQLTPNTKLCGLIGDPVDQSISDVSHNYLMNAMGLDAVYVKMQVSPAELFPFLQLAKQLPFHGLSVTMPLKEKIVPLLDKIDPKAEEIGAVNTLLFQEGTVCGFNTDGVGALNAIENHLKVQNKRMVIVGAGGAAKAIIHEAHRRGGDITIINRDASKANQVAQRWMAVGKGLDHMAVCAKAGYDVLINCTPIPLPIAADHILPQSLVMDIVTKPKETLLLQVAAEKQCQIIYGYQMFIEQALGQFQLWFQDQFDRRSVIKAFTTSGVGGDDLPVLL